MLEKEHKVFVLTHVAEKYVRQVNFYRGRTVFVSAAALKQSMSLCCCTALKTHLTDVLFGDMSTQPPLLYMVNIHMLLLSLNRYPIRVDKVRLAAKFL